MILWIGSSILNTVWLLKSYKLSVNSQNRILESVSISKKSTSGYRYCIWFTHPIDTMLYPQVINRDWCEKIINQAHKSIGILKLYSGREGWIRHFEFILYKFRSAQILFLNPASKSGYKLDINFKSPSKNCDSSWKWVDRLCVLWINLQ